MFSQKRSEAKKLYETAEMPVWKHGPTIRLDPEGLKLEGREDDKSEQRVSMEKTDCDLQPLLGSTDNKHLLTAEPEYWTKIERFNDAFFDTGFLITADEGKQATLNLDRDIISNTFKEHILVIAKKGSSITIVDRYTSRRCELKTSTIEIITEEDAVVRYANIQDLNRSCYDLSSQRIKLAKNSRIDFLTASLNAKLTRSTSNSWLDEYSEVKNYSIFLGAEEQQFDVSATVIHDGSNSNSDLYTRGVLIDGSRAVHRGLIRINKHSPNCNGYQKEETLLLGEAAVADAIPNLEIMNNEVKCSHGATIGRVDKEQLFYLASRGVPEEEAVLMIVEGFLEPVAAKLNWPEVFTVIRPSVQERIS